MTNNYPYVIDSNGVNTNIAEGIFYKIKDQRSGDILNIAHSGDGNKEHDVRSWNENPGWNITHSRFKLIPSDSKGYYYIKDQRSGDILNINRSGDGNKEHDVRSWNENPGWNITHSKFTFIPTNFRIEGKICDFTYTNPEMLIAENKSPVSLIANMRFNNDSDATLHQQISETRQKEDSFTWGFTESASLNFSNKFTVGVEAGADFLGIAEGKASSSHEFSWEVGLGFEANQSKTTTDTKTYAINQTIDIPPNSNIEGSVVVNWVSDLKIPFEAKLKLTGVVDGKKVGIEALKSFVDQEAYVIEQLIGYEGDSIIAGVKGELTCNAGFETIFAAKKI